MKNPNDPLKQAREQLSWFYHSEDSETFDAQRYAIIELVEKAIQKNNALKCNVKKLKTKILKQKRRNEKKLKTK